MERPSKKQRELLIFIDGFIKGNGYGPSYREIMRSLDYKSVSTVATHVNGLIQKGWLVKKDKSARSLEVVSVINKRIESTGEEKTEKLICDRLAELDPESEEAGVLKRALVILGFDKEYN